MGNSYSEPIPKHEDLGLVAMVFKGPDKVRLIHSPIEFSRKVFKILKDFVGEEVESQQNFGVVQLELPAAPFTGFNLLSKTDVIVCTYFLVRVFEELPQYVPILSASLSRGRGDQGTLFLKEKLGQTNGDRVVCAVAPYANDKLLLVRCNESFPAVKEALAESWSSGVKSERTLDSVCSSGTVIDLKLRGNPWCHNEVVQDSLEIKDFVGTLAKHMSVLGFHFLAAVTLRCYASGSLLFFYRDAGAPSLTVQPSSDGMTAGWPEGGGSALKKGHSATLSPYRRDRLLLQNFDLATCTNIQSVLTSYHQTKSVPIHQMAAQSLELKLDGYPFWCQGEEGISARLTMCRILASLRESGWEVATAFTGERYGTSSKSYSNSNKTTLVFTKCESARQKFACIAPTESDRLWIVNFPPGINDLIAETVRESYMPGVDYVTSCDAGARIEIGLSNDPWASSSYGLHARSMLMVVMDKLSTSGWVPIFSADFTTRESRADHLAASGSSGGSGSAGVP